MPGNDDPPLVLQNMSAVSRQVAVAGEKKQGGWGWLGWNKNNDTVAPEPQSRVSEIKITKAPQAPTTAAPPPKPIGAMASMLGSSKPQSPPTKNEPQRRISEIKITKAPQAPTTAAPPPTSIAALASMVGSSKPQSPPTKTEQSTDSTKSTTRQSQTTASKSSSFTIPKSSPNARISSSSQRRSRTLGKEEEFLLEMREKRKGPDEEDPFTWYEDDLLQRQTDLNEDETYALELLDRRRKFGASNLSPEEVEDLDMLVLDRQEAIHEEEEMSEILDRKYHGEPYNKDRLYHLELLAKRRQNLGQGLTEEEEADLKMLEEVWLEALADREELNSLLDHRDNGEEVNEARIYELELLERKRLGETDFTKAEQRDLDFLERKRLDVQLDLEEYRELLQLRESGEPVDEDRFYILELVDKRHHNEELTEVEVQDLADYDVARNEQHLDRIEYEALIEAKQTGATYDEDRLRFLELLEKKRQNQSLSEEEADELDFKLWERDQAQRDAEELAELLDKKLTGEDFDEDRLYLLDLVDQKREGENLSTGELEELEQFQETRRNDYLDAQELNRLLDRLDRGESVDEDRLYELQLREKERLGDPLTDEELADLDLFDKAKQAALAGNQKGKSVSLRTDGHMDDDSNDENWDNFSLGSQDLKDIKRLHKELEKEGLPRTIKIHDRDHENMHSHSSRMSVASIGDDSYIQDLLAQRDRREEDRREETLEEALELYQVALKEKNLKESEQLFMMIFNELLKESSENAKEADRKQDELIEREIRLAELRRVQKDEETEPDQLKAEEEAADAAQITAEAARVQAVQEAADSARIKAEQIAAEAVRVQAEQEAAEAAGIRAEKEAAEAARIKAEQEAAEAARVQAEREAADAARIKAAQEAAEAARVKAEQEAAEAARLKAEQEAVDAARVTAERLMLDIGDVPKSQIESDSARIEQEELDELNDLYDQRDRGEEINEDRLYELELFDRQRQGEELNDEEQEDLQFFTKQRLLYNRFKVELDSLRTKQANGDTVDEDRLYLLELADKKRRWEDLSVDELDDLEEFIVEEEEKQEHSAFEPVFREKPPAGISPEEALPLFGEDYETTKGAGAQDGSIALSDQLTEVHLIDKDYDEKLEQMELDELNDLYDRQDRGEVINEDRLYELELFDRRRQGEELNDEEQKDLEFFSIQRNLFARFKRELDSLRQRSTDGESIDGHRLYLLEIADRKRRGEELSSDELDDLEEFVVEEEKIQTNDASMGALTDAADDGVGETNADQEAIEAARIANERLVLEVGDGPHTEFELNGARMDQEELDELNDLYDRQDRGEEIDEDRLYELELFDRQRQGEELNDEEQEDLQFFTKQRLLYNHFKVELDSLRTKQANGDTIDEDRLYLLELADKRRRREDLSVDELDDLEEFIVEEEVKQEHSAFEPISGEKAREDVSPDEAHPPIGDTEAARLKAEQEAAEADRIIAEQEAAETARILAKQEAAEAARIKADEEAAESARMLAEQEAAEAARIKAEQEAAEAACILAVQEAAEAARIKADEEAAETVRILAEQEAAEAARIKAEREAAEAARVQAEQEAAVAARIKAEREAAEAARVQAEQEAAEATRRKVEQETVEAARIANERLVLEVGDGPHTEFELNGARMDQEELDELNDLYDRQDRGEEIDEDRLYELELFDRQRQGEELNDEEQEDLQFFTKQRLLYNHFKVELDSLRTKQANGDTIDEDRLYLLELADKRRRREDLSVDELDDLEEFIVEEEEKQEHSAFEPISGEKAREDVSPDEAHPPIGDTEAARLKAEQEAAEADRIIAEQEAAETARILAKQEAAEAARIKADEEAAESARMLAEQEAAEAARIKAEQEAAEAACILAVQEAAEAARIKADEEAAETVRILAEQEAAEAARIKAEREAAEAARVQAEQEAAEAARIKADEEAAETARILAEQEAAEAARIKAEREAAEAARVQAEQEAAEATRRKVEQETVEAARIANERLVLEVGDGPHTEFELNGARMDQEELDELNDLYDRQDRGEEIDEDRLYELELFDRQRQGEELNDEEQEDLQFFTKQRLLYNHFKVELDSLRTKQANGDTIDEDRLYLLELADKRRRREDLSVDELDDLEEFIVEEEEKQEHSAFEPISGEKAREDVSPDEAHPPIGDTEAARLKAEQEAAEADRIIAEQEAAETARILAKQEAAEAARIKADEEAAESARMLAEQEAAEAARIKAEQEAAEAARILAEQEAAEAARIKADDEAAETARMLAEQEAAEAARIKAEQEAAEAARILAEQEAAEAARIKADDEAAETARMLAEQEAAEAACILAEQEAAEAARIKADEEAAETARILAEQGAAEAEEVKIDPAEDKGQHIGIEEPLDSQAQQDLDELAELYEKQELGLKFDEDRLYELELRDRQRQGEVLNDRELDDLEFFHRRGIMYNRLGSEYQVLLEMKEEGKEINEDRLYFLELVEIKRTGGVLSIEELDDLEVFLADEEAAGALDGTFDQEELNNQEFLSEIEELNELLDRHERGEVIDEERLYELELLDRQRRGEPLSGQEQEDLAFFTQTREQELRYKEELTALLRDKAAGQKIDMERLYFLDLLDRQRNGETLADDELEDLELMMLAEDSATAKPCERGQLNHAGSSEERTPGESASIVAQTPPGADGIHEMERQKELEQLRIEEARRVAEEEAARRKAEEEAAEIERQKDLEHQIAEAIRMAEEEAARRKAEAEAAKSAPVLGWGAKIFGFGGKKQEPPPNPPSSAREKELTSTARQPPDKPTSTDLPKTPTGTATTDKPFAELAKRAEAITTTPLEQKHEGPAALEPLDKPASADLTKAPTGMVKADEPSAEVVNNAEDIAGTTPPFPVVAVSVLDELEDLPSRWSPQNATKSLGVADVPGVALETLTAPGTELLGPDDSLTIGKSDEAGGIASTFELGQVGARDEDAIGVADDGKGHPSDASTADGDFQTTHGISAPQVEPVSSEEANADVVSDIDGQPESYGEETTADVVVYDHEELKDDTGLPVVESGGPQAAAKRIPEPTTAAQETTLETDDLGSTRIDQPVVDAAPRDIVRSSVGPQADAEEIFEPPGEIQDRAVEVHDAGVEKPDESVLDGSTTESVYKGAQELQLQRSSVGPQADAEEFFEPPGEIQDCAVEVHDAAVENPDEPVLDGSTTESVHKCAQGLQLQSSTSEDTDYENLLLERFRKGERLNKDELFEMRAFSKQRQGVKLGENDRLELDRLRSARLKERVDEKSGQGTLEQLRSLKSEGKDHDEELLYELELFERRRLNQPLDEIEKRELELFIRRRSGERITDDDWGEIEAMKHRRSEDILDLQELADLRDMVASGQKVDGERFYELEQKEKLRLGHSLSEDEMYELELFDRLQNGENLTDEELDDLEMFRMDRLDVFLAKGLESLRAKESAGEAVDQLLRFELELFERRRLESLLTDDELYLLQLLEKKHLGDKLSENELDDVQDLLLRLRPKTKDESYMLDDEDRYYRRALTKRRDDGETLDRDESFELEILNRAEEGDLFFESEISELEALRASREERSRDKEDLRTLRGKRDAGEEFDENLLYELELFEKHRHRQELDDDEKFELEMFEKRRDGEELLPDELDELDTIRRQRELRALDEKDLADLLERKRRGEEVDEDFLYELQLFDRKRKNAVLNADERFEYDLFLKRREGHVLTDAEIEDLEAVKENRLEIMKEAEQIRQIKARRDDGELIDGDFLHELELFHRRRIGESLTEDEHYEIALLEKRRSGVELSEAELDKLASLKSARYEKLAEGELEDRGEEEDPDAAHIRRQRQRIQRGERLHRNELTELELLERQKRGEELSSEEAEELEILRQERTRKSMAFFNTWDLGLDDYDDDSSSMSRESTKKKTKEKKRKKKKEKKIKPPKPPKETKPKEKRMRKKKKPQPAFTPIVVKKPGEPEMKDPEPKMETKLPPPPPKPPILSPTPPKGEPPKKGLFGGLFGKKSKKELELEEAKRRQEELIKEQLRAMQLDAELEAMEKEKEIQETLVQEVIESMSKGDMSLSSWETDTSYEESQPDVESVEEQEPSEESLSDSDSSSSSESVSVSSREHFGRRDEQSFHNSDEKKSVRTMESNEPWSEGGLSAPLQGSRQAQNEKRTEDRTASVSKASKDSSIIATSNGPDKMSSEDRPGLSLPPKHITTVEERPMAPELDGVSVVSDGSIEEMEDANAPNQSSSASQARSKRRARRGAPRNISKSSALSAHLRKQKKEQKKLEKRKQVSRYGDDISLGTVGLKSQPPVDAPKQEERPSQDSGNFEGNNAEAAPKPIRPWQDSIPSGKPKYFGSLGTESQHRPKERHKSNFFEDNKHVFDRSIFNFSTTFAKIEEDEKSEGALSDDKESESDTSEPLKGATAADEAPVEDIDEQQMMESVASIGYEAEQSFSIFNYGGIESKLADKMKDKEEEFNEAWEKIEADKAVAAQMNQRRMMRLRESTTGREEKKDEGMMDIPRLFLFEGEKVKKKKKKRGKKKERKKLKKLESTLSKEFRKAMKEVFESESEEEYDRTFGEHGEETKPKSSNLKRRASNESMYDSDAHTTDSGPSEGENSEEEFDDDYLKRLRDKSMQQEVKEMLYEKKSEDGSVASEEESQASEISRGRRAPVRADSNASFESGKKAAKSTRRRRRPRKNRSGEIVGEDIDPAEVYAQELEKKKVRKTFTISDLKKEMEEMRQGTTAASFDDAFDGIATGRGVSLKAPKTPKNPKTPLNKPKKFNPGKSPKPTGPGVNSLRNLHAQNDRPTFNRQTSFATQNSDQGLLGGGRKGFDTPGRKNNFDIGGTLAAVPTIEEDDEEAFLTGESPHPGMMGDPRTPGGGRSRFSPANFGTAVSGFASTLKTPLGRGKLGVGVKTSPGFASNEGGMGGVTAIPNSGLGGLGGTGFQEPLPVPEMQEDYSGRKQRRVSVTAIAGKMKMSMKGFGFGKKKQASQDFGGMLNDDQDDEMQGGLLG